MKTIRIALMITAKIAEMKMEDLNARDLEHAQRIIEGTARSMGIEVDA